jgi:two-component system sensor histidine kinase KdpD
MNAPSARGKLKIFLGYASHVGKSYAMLEAAAHRIAEGDDVVAASATLYWPPDTATLLDRIEKVPPRQLLREGQIVAELDLDAVLARRPQLAIIDDLAHTNVPRMRHHKRYQDILELLNAGIDVYTTLNVYQLESLNDIVAQITGVEVHDTVPDWLVDMADDIELVDLPIDELLERLELQQDRPQSEPPTFFRRGNLTALRELALRVAADSVDRQMRDYMQSHGIAGPWPAQERLLVCVGPGPLSERLVRTASRLAGRLNAEWTAVYVETAAASSLAEAERERLAHTLNLAEQLGGRSISLPGTSVAEAIAAHARDHNVTKIIAGKPLQPRWLELLRGSIVEQIIRLTHNVDVYVISAESSHQPPYWSRSLFAISPDTWRSLLYGGLLVVLTTLLALPLRSVFEPTNMAMLYLLVVVISAVALGRAPAILTSLLSVIAFDLVYVPPYYNLEVADAQYLLTFAALLVVGLLISTLTVRAREQARSAQRREAQTAVLYELSRDLAAAAEINGVAHAVITHTQKVSGGEAAIFVYKENSLSLISASRAFPLHEVEQQMVGWAPYHEENGDRGPATLAHSSATSFLLRTARRVVGVLGVATDSQHEELDPEQRHLLESFASQAALAVERSLLAEEARQAHLLQETEKLQSALLNSISHDLRTPLATVTGALSSLHDDRELLTPQARQQLVASAYTEAERLNRLLGNLLDMTRLESGAIRITAELVEVEDLTGAALAQLSNRLQQRQVVIDIPARLPPVRVDLVLMVQVLVNLIDNAHKYSPPGSPIEIRARRSDEELWLEIADQGPGIPPDQLERIFDKFFRGRNGHDTAGTGLGLAISRGIVEAHGGRIWAANRDTGGAIFTIALALQSGAEADVEVER